MHHRADPSRKPLTRELHAAPTCFSLVVASLVSFGGSALAVPLSLYDLLHTSATSPDVGALMVQPVGPLTAGDGAHPAADDWDGDGDVDLFVGSQYGDLLYFENVEAGPQPVYAAGLPLRLDVEVPQDDAGAACVPRVIDWDGDGAKDLLVCIGGRLFVCRTPDVRSSEPLHAVAVQLAPDADSGLSDISSAQPVDWNADGLLDLVVGTKLGRVLLLRGQGSRSAIRFARAEPFVMGGAPLRLGADVQVCTWPGEETPPALLVGCAQGGLRLFRAVGTDGSLALEETPLTLRYASQASRTESKDLTAVLAEPSPAVAQSPDGRTVLFVGVADGFVEAFAANGPADIRHIGRVPQQDAPIDVGTTSAPVLADWDGDGIPDLIVGSNDGCVYWFRGRDPRRGVFLPGARLTVSGDPIRMNTERASDRHSYVQPLVADWDGDGDPDLLLGSDDGEILFFENRGEPGGPELSPPRQLSTGRTPIRHCGPASMVLYDWNLDGDKDLFVGCGEQGDDQPGGLVPSVANGGLVYYENIAASPKLAPRFFKGARLDCKVPVAFPAATIRDAAAMELGIVGITDWDGDGRRDFILSGQGGTVYLFRAQGAPGAYPELELAAELTGSITGLVAEHAYAPSLADVNGDGRDDLLCGTDRYGFVRWRDRRSLPSWPPSTTSLSGPHPYTAVDLSAPISRDGTVSDWRIAIAPGNTRPRYRLRILRRQGSRLVLVGQSKWNWVKPGWNMFSCDIPGVRRGDFVGFASGQEGETTAVVAARAGKTLYIVGGELTESRALSEWENADLHLAIEVTVR